MKKILYLLIFLGILILVFLYLSLFNKNNQESNKSQNEISTITYHNGKNISELLTKENYDKVGINPEKYKNFKEFLIEFKSFTGIQIDPLNEDFSIGIKKSNGNIIYIPFDYTKSNDNFNNDQNKNLAILDIYSAYKDGMVFGGANSKSGDKIIFNDEINHPETKELNKIFGREVNVNDYIKSLEKVTDKTTSKKELLSYLYDFLGEYDKANEERKELCNESENCNELSSKITIEGKILDENNSPISGAKIELLNNDTINSTSTQDGSYKLEFNMSPFSHLRFKATKEGYSDGFVTSSLTKSLDEENKEINLKSNITLNKYSELVDINKTNAESYKKGKYYVIKTEYSTYFVPTDGLYYEDGKNYTDENFLIYVYQFNKSSNMSNLLENDTFEPVFGYVGNIMKTFGMPYIQFIDKKTKQELFVKSSNPMILQNQIYHMKELYENYDKIYEAVTQEDMKTLYEYSENNEGYPIDFDYLTKNNFLRWPARWVLDRKTGTWSNIGQKLLNENGLVELPFYSIKDN